jgi:adenylate cyclase
MALNPSFARGWHVSGFLRLNAGEYDTAIVHYERAMRLSPRARVGQSSLSIGQGHFYMRRFEQALPKLLLAIQEDRSVQVSYRHLAACYAHMGRLDEAREVVAQLRELTSVVIAAPGAFLRNAERRELLFSGLRMALGEKA